MFDMTYLGQDRQSTVFQTIVSWEGALTRPYEAWSLKYKPRSLAQRPTLESYRSARCSHVACVGVVRSEVFDETSDSLVKYRLILPYEGRSRARRS